VELCYVDRNSSGGDGYLLGEFRDFDDVGDVFMRVGSSMTR
jgi:hypothetical protein